MNHKICVLLHDLRGGGAERVSLKLVQGMVDAGREVDLILVRAVGDYIGQIPKGVRLIDLNKKHVLQAIPALVSYLRRERPRALLSSLTHVNLIAVVARYLARVPTRVVGWSTIR